MKEPKLQSHPGYKLLTQSDVISYFHMQMPRWLFCDAKYRQLSLEAKVAYTFLLNRFQLSRMNGWINADNEVFIIFPREKLAEEIGISYRKAISCCKELLEAQLIWEHRVGRGNANRIYMAAVVLSDDSAAAHSSAPFTAPVAQPKKDGEKLSGDGAAPRSAETAGLGDGVSCKTPEEPVSAPRQGVPYPQDKNCDFGTSAYTEMALPDLPDRHTSKKDFSKKEKSEIDTVSPSSTPCALSKPGCREQRPTDNNADDDLEDAMALLKILEGCDLDVLPEEEAGVFRNAITRLFYSMSLKVGSAVLPRAVIRSQLSRLDGMILMDTREKLRHNLHKPVKNSTVYVMTTLLNNIWEIQSDLMVDPYLNSMGAG